jgi:predicted nucleic acid-binding protein
VRIADIIRFSGEKKKRPAIAKFPANGLMFRRRRELSNEVMWQKAAALGLKLSDAGKRIPTVDLMIATICIHHEVALATFDAHFEPLVKIGRLDLKLFLCPEQPLPCPTCSAR